MKFGPWSFPEYRLKGFVLLAIGILATLVFVILGLYTFLRSKPARVELYLGGERRMFEGETTRNMTILEAMYASSLAGNITFKYAIDPIKNQTIILALDGYADDTKDTPPRFYFYLNSQRIETDKIHLIAINPGDVITIKTE